MEEDLAGFLGPNKRFQDLLDAAAAIKRKLAGLGFFLADVVVPEQKIANGIVELRVLEGRLGKVRLVIDPATRIDRELLQSYIDGLEEGGLIRTSDVERALFQIHDLRGIVATSSFAPGTASGTADLTIRVSPAKTFDILPAPWVAMRMPAVRRRISNPVERPVSPIKFLSIAIPLLAVDYALRPSPVKVLTRRLEKANYTFEPTFDSRRK